MNMKEIFDFINGNRKVIIIDNNYKDSGIFGYGLGPTDKDSKPVKKYEHYYISSGRCKNREEAEQQFWSEYENNKPFINGDIYWRTDPSINVYDDFEKKRLYVLLARFSMLHPCDNAEVTEKQDIR